MFSRVPGAGLRRVRRPPRDRPTLTLAELDRLADAVPAAYRALILVAGVLGLRWSEIVGLQIGDIDFLRRRLSVGRTISEVEGVFHVADTKSRSSQRTMSVPSFLIDDLARHLAAQRIGATQTDLVFTAPKGGPLRRFFEGRTFKTSLDKAGVDRQLTFHGLRHVATSLMVESGEHPRATQARLGHATARLSMELYAHVPDAADRDVAAHLDAGWARALLGGSGTIGHAAGTTPPEPLPPAPPTHKSPGHKRWR